MNEKETISYDNWEIQRYGKGTPYPFIIIDNWYLPHEEKLVWSEIDFLISNPLFGEMADDSSEEVAKYDGKKSKAMNKRICLLYTSPSPRDTDKSRMPSSA